METCTHRVNSISVKWIIWSHRWRCDPEINVTWACVWLGWWLWCVRGVVTDWCLAIHACSLTEWCLGRRVVAWGVGRSCRLTEFKQPMTAKQGHYERRQLKPDIPSWVEPKRSHLASVQTWTWQESVFLWTVQIAVVSAIFSSVYWEIFGSRINSVLIIVDWPRIYGLTIG